MGLAVVAGVAGVAANGIGATAWYFYERPNADMQRDPPVEEIQPTRQTRIPQWARIQITQRQFQNLRVLTENRFRQRVQKYICFVTYQIMRQPSTMRCCQVRAQKFFLKAYIRNHQRCPICHHPADLSYIEQDDQIADQILEFRSMVLKTYRRIPLNQRPHWKQLIDSYFGEGYTEEHLQ